MRVGKLAALQTLDLLDHGSLGGEGLLQALDEVLVGFFFAGDVEGEEDFVSVFHGWFAVVFEDLSEEGAAL